MQDLLKFILQNTLGKDVDFEINTTEDEIGYMFTVDVAEEYRGKLIGKSGRNIQAIRDILFVLARKQNKRVYLRLAD